MISVSDLAPVLAILGAIIFLDLQRVRFGKGALFILVTYITALLKDHYFNHCVTWFYTFVEQ